MKKFKDIFYKIVDPVNLFEAWYEFKKGKGNKQDVVLFEQNIESYIFALSRDLKNWTYKHGGYKDFYILDPKRRHVHKATVRDRILHHVIMKVFYPIFDPLFIDQSFSCRVWKWSHKWVECLSSMLWKESLNNTRNCYVLKCDIAKFFDSIGHEILLNLLATRIKDSKMMDITKELIYSFKSYRSDEHISRGVPIWNLTSQIFANVYMNEFDQFMKHQLKVRYYARYTDDFVIVSKDKDYLHNLLPKIETFLYNSLGLNLHPDKVEIRKYSQGVDFLGYVIFPNHRIIRKRTKKRIFRKWKETMLKHEKGLISSESFNSTLQSYLGVLSHANAYNLSQELKNERGLFFGGGGGEIDIIFSIFSSFICFRFYLKFSRSLTKMWFFQKLV